MNRDMDFHDEVDSEGSWAVSYGDMITLLLTFFIVFFTLDPNQEKTQAMKLSLMNQLKISSSNDLYQGSEHELDIGKADKRGIDSEVVKTWNGIAHDRGNYVIIEFPGVSFFRSAKTDLTKEGEKALFRFVQSYMPFAGNYKLSIRAYADPRKVIPNARFKDNLELSALRSVATMRHLQKAGLPLNRIRVGGYGELMLTAKDLENIPEASRGPASELNLARKVVLVVEPDLESESGSKQ